MKLNLVCVVSSPDDVHGNLRRRRRRRLSIGAWLKYWPALHERAVPRGDKSPWDEVVITIGLRV